jgi:hypothetical protein
MYLVTPIIRLGLDDRIEAEISRQDKRVKRPIRLFISVE